MDLSALAAVEDPTTAVEVWSAVGIWAGAAGTTLAAWIALRIARTGWDRADALRADDRKAQARLVMVRRKRGRSLREIANESQGMIFNVVPTVVVEYDDPDLIGSVNDPGPFDLVAGEHRTCGINVRVRATGERADPLGPVRKPVRWDASLTFTDAAGLRWFRHEQDEPVRVIDEPPRTLGWRHLRLRRKQSGRDA